MHLLLSPIRNDCYYGFLPNLSSESETVWRINITTQRKTNNLRHSNGGGNVSSVSWQRIHGLLQGNVTSNVDDAPSVTGQKNLHLIPCGEGLGRRSGQQHQNKQNEVTSLLRITRDGSTRLLRREGRGRGQRESQNTSKALDGKMSGDSFCILLGERGTRGSSGMGGGEGVPYLIDEKLHVLFRDDHSFFRDPHRPRGRGARGVGLHLSDDAVHLCCEQGREEETETRWYYFRGGILERKKASGSRQEWHAAEKRNHGAAPVVKHTCNTSLRNFNLFSFFFPRGCGARVYDDGVMTDMILFQTRLIAKWCEGSSSAWVCVVRASYVVLFRLRHGRDRIKLQYRSEKRSSKCRQRKLANGNREQELRETGWCVCRLVGEQIGNQSRNNVTGRRVLVARRHLLHETRKKRQFLKDEQMPFPRCAPPHTVHPFPITVPPTCGQHCYFLPRLDRIWEGKKKRFPPLF